MAKKTYTVQTNQVITQTWEYEFETDQDFKTDREILNFIYNNGIDGHCMDDDEVIQEEIWSVEEKGLDFPTPDPIIPHR